MMFTDIEVDCVPRRKWLVKADPNTHYFTPILRWTPGVDLGEGAPTPDTLWMDEWPVEQVPLDWYLPIWADQIPWG